MRPLPGGDFLKFQLAWTIDTVTQLLKLRVVLWGCIMSCFIRQYKIRP